MSNQIKLTPGVLKAQAADLRALAEDYSAFFSYVNSELKDINNNWSAKLANNFLMKVTNADKTFNELVLTLDNGYKAAIKSAEKFENADGSISGNLNDTLDKNLYKEGAVKDSFKEKLKKAVIGTVEADIATIKQVKKAVEKEYNKHGLLYDITNYGKCALKVAKGAIKIVGAVGAIATGVGVPIALLSIVSAGNDIVNAMTDAAYVYTNQYDMVGKVDNLKNLLVSSGGEIGEALGNKGLGEKVGEIVYGGIDTVSFLNGVDKTTKNLKKLNTVNNAIKANDFWSNEYLDMALKEDNKFDLSLGYLAKKYVESTSSSITSTNYNVLQDAFTSVYKSVSKAAKVGTEIVRLFG